MRVHFKGWLTILALVLAALVMITLVTQGAHATGPRYVAPGGTDSSNDCKNKSAPCATIQHAVDEADPGDTIYVATGTYTGTDSIVARLDKNVTLSGGWDGTFTTQSGISTIDGEGARRGMTVNSGVTAIVERFTVSNGDTSWDGGGIGNGGTLTLNNSTVSGNTANDDGGGIYNTGTLTLNNSTVSGNTAKWHGGGIYNDYGTVTLNSSTVSGNGGDGAGDGIYGAYTLTLNNSTVSGNTGDGIYYYGHIGSLTLNNSTISGNTGVGISHWSAWTAPVTLQNTILAGNTAGSGPDCSDTIGSAGYNLIGDTSGCTFTPISGDLTNIDAKLGPLQDNGGPTETHALLPGSPAIDHIPPGNCTVLTDQRGAARPQPDGGNCDIGAYELEQEPTAITLVSFSAEAGAGGVTLAWETGTELDNAGFNLYRAMLKDGPYTQVNDALIVAQGDPVSGASYSFADAPGYGTFYYQLEDIDYYGVSTLHGPVKATVARPFRRPLYRPSLPEF